MARGVLKRRRVLTSLGRSSFSKPVALGATIALLLVALAPPARAQLADAGLPAAHVGADVRIGPDVPRSISARSIQPLWVSYADCIDGDAFNFSIVLSGLAANANGSPIELQVWESEGTDCSLYVNRFPELTVGQVATNLCTQIGQKSYGLGQNNSGNITIQFTSAQIANAVFGVTNCNDTGMTTATLPHPVQLFFILIRSTTTADALPADFSVWNKTQVDLLGPNPPANVAAGVADGFLVLNYDTSTQSSDFLNYNVYCDPPPGGGSYNFSLLDGGMTTASSAGGSAGTAGGSGGTASAGGATGGSGGAGGSGATGVSNAVCPSNVLVTGQIPDSRIPLCGSAQGTSAATVDLIDGTSYNVGVAGVDILGNAGVMSNISCATPQPVDDFFKLYRLDGGKAGGGYCSVGAVGASSTMLGALAFGTALGLTLRRRMRRHAKRVRR